MLKTLTVTRRRGRPIVRIRLDDGRTAETPHDSDHQAAANLHNRFAYEGLSLYDPIITRLERRRGEK